MQKLLLVAGSVALCQLLSGCGSSTATTSCKLVDGDKQIDCAGISAACCTAHRTVENISAKERAISVKETMASEVKDHAELAGLEKVVAGAVAAQGKACTVADNVAFEKCYFNKSGSGPAAELVAEVPREIASEDSEDSEPFKPKCTQDTGGTCGGWACNEERGAECKDEKCFCAPWECVEFKEDQSTGYMTRWAKRVFGFVADNGNICVLEPETGEARKKEFDEKQAKDKAAKAQEKAANGKDLAEDKSAANQAKADQELAQFNNQAFAGLAGFVAGGVVLIAVAKIRTSSKRTDENSYQNMEG